MKIISAIRHELANIFGFGTYTDHLDGSEAELVARELGLSVSELTTIAARRPETNLLQERMHRLGISEISRDWRATSVMRDLQRVCTLCTSQRICKHDLASKNGSDRWRAYCPNTQTFDALRRS